MGSEMKRLCKLLRLIGTTTSLLIALFGALWLFGGIPTAIHTIENGKKIDQAFSVSYTWVEAFRKKNGRLPEQREFDAWAGALQDETNWVKHIGVLSKPSQYPSEITEAFGDAPDGAYVLELWRGEWTEYFASWRMKSTVDGAFGLFGYLILIALLLFGVAAGIRYVSLKYCRTE